MSRIITESQLWKRIKPKLEKHGPAFRIEAIATPGFPDAIWFPGTNIPQLLELKVRLIFSAQQKKLFQQLPIHVVWQRYSYEEPMVYLGSALLALMESRHSSVPLTQGRTIADWITEVVVP